MRTNYHTHTTRCLHATGSDEEFVLSAIKGGYQELGFSDHTPWKYHTNYISDIRMTPEELPDYVESLRSLQEKYKDRISLKIGLECEYFPDYLHWLKEVIREFKLDYIIFGNHHFHTDEKFPYFGRNTKTVDMLELYEESAIEGMESGLFAYFAHPDLFMRSYPEFDRHCKLISRHICRTAARLNLPLEYNIGYEDYNDAHKITTIPHPDFWKIAAVCLMARDKGEFTPRRQILIYPALGNCYTEESPYRSVQENGCDYLLTSVKMEDYLNLYQSSAEDRQNPYFAPILEKDLRNLPETLILTAEYDPLRDEGEVYGRKLHAAGNHVEVHRIYGAFHGFFALGIKFLHVQESFKYINRFLNKS